MAVTIFDRFAHCTSDTWIKSSVFFLALSFAHSLFLSLFIRSPWRMCCLYILHLPFWFIWFSMALNFTLAPCVIARVGSPCVCVFRKHVYVCRKEEKKNEVDEKNKQYLWKKKKLEVRRCARTSYIYIFNFQLSMFQC